MPDSRSPTVAWGLRCRPILVCRSKGSETGKKSGPSLCRCRTEVGSEKEGFLEEEML